MVITYRFWLFSWRASMATRRARRARPYVKGAEMWPSGSATVRAPSRVRTAAASARAPPPRPPGRPGTGTSSSPTVARTCSASAHAAAPAPGVGRCQNRGPAPPNSASVTGELRYGRHLRSGTRQTVGWEASSGPSPRTRPGARRECKGLGSTGRAAGSRACTCVCAALSDGLLRSTHRECFFNEYLYVSKSRIKVRVLAHRSCR